MNTEHWLKLDWTTVTTDKLAGMAAIVKEEQKRVAVELGNGYFISVRRVSSDATTMQRGTCGHAAQWPMRRRFYATAVAAAAAAAAASVCIGKLVIYN